jgi:hypothetical protein
MYLGWDVGIRNLAYCLIDYEPEPKKIDKSKKNKNNLNKDSLDEQKPNVCMKVVDWGVISLVKNHINEPVFCCYCMGNQKTCGKKAFYLEKNNKEIGYCKVHSKKVSKELIEYSEKIICSCESCNAEATRYHPDTETYYCTKHTPKNIKDECEKIVKNVSKTPLLQLGKSLFKELNKLPILLKATNIVIENQPVLKNPTMKSIQMMLYSYFIMKKNEDSVDNPKLLEMVLMSAKNKLKIYDGPKIDKFDNLKSEYSKNKKLAIEHCKYFIQDDPHWNSFFNETSKNKKNACYGKNDDLSDAYLMTRYYISKLHKLLKK